MQLEPKLAARVEDERCRSVGQAGSEVVDVVFLPSGGRMHKDSPRGRMKTHLVVVREWDGWGGAFRDHFAAAAEHFGFVVLSVAADAAPGDVDAGSAAFAQLADVFVVVSSDRRPGFARARSARAD